MTTNAIRVGDVEQIDGHIRVHLVRVTWYDATETSEGIGAIDLVPADRDAFIVALLQPRPAGASPTATDGYAQRARTVLLDAEAEVRRRRTLAAAGADPAAFIPMTVVVREPVAVLGDPAARAAAELVARLGPKTRFSLEIYGTSCMPGFLEDFGGSPLLRQMALSDTANVRYFPAAALGATAKAALL